MGKNLPWPRCRPMSRISTNPTKKNQKQERQVKQNISYCYIFLILHNLIILNQDFQPNFCRSRFITLEKCNQSSSSEITGPTINVNIINMKMTKIIAQKHHKS